ncbi:MAG: hypothetical protein JJE49_04975 [Peptostreptococcaceae bacterium]|nr:hypothetical protein [Peptostreptococcaceae bacterium]
MKELFKNWNYAKHACAVTTIYVTASIAGNLLMGTSKKLKKADCRAVSKCVKQLSKKEKIFNIAVVGCYIFDMTATYGAIKLIQRKFFK